MCTVYCPPCGSEQQRTIQLLAGYLSSFDAHVGTKWHFAVSASPLAVNPITEANALVANIFEHLQQNVGIDGHQGRASTFEGLPLKSMAVWWATKPGRLTSKFSLVYYEDGLYGFISDSGSPDGQAQPWLDALDSALAKQAKGVQSHEWSGVIGIRSAGMQASLSTVPVKVGPLTIQPCEFCYQEAFALPTSLQSQQFHRWTPVVVRGQSHGHSWQAAQFDAHEQLYLLCNLLSVESDAYWGLREAPRPAEWGDVTLPDTTARLERHVDRDIGLKTIELDGERLTRMWNRCKTEEQVVVPLSAYYEALALTEHHPSFALVGFVSAIEEIGKLLVPTGKAGACPTCSKPMFNSALKRFRDALALVLPAEKVRTVSDRLYGWRSRTAHAGRTFDWEKSFGHVSVSESMLIAKSQSLFRARGHSHAQEIARDLLLRLFN